MITTTRPRMTDDAWRDEQFWVSGSRATVRPPSKFDLPKPSGEFVTVRRPVPFEVRVA